MHADERTRTITRHEWVLPTPAHHTEVTKALAVAIGRREAEPGFPTDIEFTHGDDEIVLGYSVAVQPGPLGEAVDQILRAERDEYRRKAESTMDTVQRARRLAVHWSGADGAYADTWHQASADLNAALGGTESEPGGLEAAAFEDLLGCISLYVDWRFVTKQLTTGQRNRWADAHDAWAARMGHEQPAKADRWWDR